MKIKITSPCMAMLIYEAAKSQGQTEGCLYGEMAQEITKNITDSDVTTTVEDVLCKEIKIIVFFYIKLWL